MNLNLSFFLKIFFKRFFLILKCCVILLLIICTKYLDKNEYIFLNIYRYSNSKCTGAYFCLLIFINLAWVPDIKLYYSILALFLENSQDYLVKISHFGHQKPNKSGKSNPTMEAHLSFNNENKNKSKSNSGPHSPQKASGPSQPFTNLQFEIPTGSAKTQDSKTPIYHSKPPLGPQFVTRKLLPLAGWCQFFINLDVFFHNVQEWTRKKNKKSWELHKPQLLTPH